MEPRTVSVDVPVGALDVLVWEGNGGAPAEEPARTVLALHGFPESAWEWKGVAESLAGQGVRVIAPMQRGYSPDARPEGVDAYAIEHLADDALAVMDHQGGIARDQLDLGAADVDAVAGVGDQLSHGGW